MAAVQFYIPYDIMVKPGNLGTPNGTLYVYATGTLNPLPVYATSALTTQLSNPVVADGSGRLPPIYLDNSLAYRIRAFDKDGSLLLDRDPYIPGSAPDAAALAPYQAACEAAAEAAALDAANVAAVLGHIANIDAVAADLTNINAVQADLTNINTMAADLANLNIVAGAIANVNAVGGSIANVTAVAGDLTALNAVAADLTNLNLVAADIANLHALALDLTALNAVQADLTNINALAGDLTNLNTVAGGITAINTVATNIAGVNTAATNIAAILDAPNQAASAAASAASLLPLVASTNVAKALDTSRTIAGVKDVAGSFLTGTHMDGRPIKSRSLRRPRLDTFTDGAGYKQIEVCDRYGRSRLTAGRYNNWAAEWVSADAIYFTSDRRGFPEPYAMSPDGSNQTALTTIWNHWQIDGQSWSLGTNTGASGTTPVALTTVNATPNAYMLTTNGGVGTYGPRTNLDDTNGTAVDDRFIQAADVTGLEPIREVAGTTAMSSVMGETPASGFAAQFMKNADATQRIVVDCNGRGSAGWQQPAGSSFPDVELCPRSFHFANKFIAQSLVRKYVEAGGSWGAAGDYLFGGVVTLHGQADSTNRSPTGVPTPRATYKQQISDWIAAFNRHGRSRSRYHRSKRLYALQNSVMTTSLPGAFEIARAQQEAAAADPLVLCFAPSYWAIFNTTDNLHPNAAYVRRFGEVAGKWARRIEREIKAQPMFFPTKAIVSGSTVTCSYLDPNGKSLLPWGLPIVLDGGVNVAAVANSGVKYYDSGGSGITVSSVAVSADGTQLIVTLSGAPNLANTPYLTFGDASTSDGTHAGKTLGARTNIRNAETEVGLLSGSVLYDWHLQGQISVTAS